MAHLLTVRTSYDFIELHPVDIEIVFYKKFDQKEIKESIEELQDIVNELKSYVENE